MNIKEISGTLFIILLLGFWIPHNILFLITFTLVIWDCFKNNRIKKRLYTHSWIFIVILILGIVMDIYTHQNIKLYTLIRFSFYVFAPILYIYAGTIEIKKANIYKVLRTIYLVGGLNVILFFITIVYDVISFGISFAVFRNAKSSVTILVVINIFIYLLFVQENKLFSKKINNLIFIGSIFTTLISFSRTGLLMLLIGFVIYLLSYAKILFLLKSFFLIIVIFVMIAMNEKFSVITIDYLEQLLKSSEELSTDHEWDFKDINNNWRGYEIYLEQSQFKNANIIQKLFGTGASGVFVGSNAKLVTKMPGDGYIPVLHNGYYGVLAYSGLLGLTLYILFYLLNYKYVYLQFKKKGRPIDVLLKIVILNTAISTLIVMGPVSPTGALYPCMLLGILRNCKDEIK